MAEDLCYDDGSALQALHDQVYGGPGTPVVESASGALRVLQPWVSSSSGRIQDALGGAGVDWHGQAADATAAALQRVGQWADRGGQATGDGGGRVQDYASSFAWMKPQIVEPQPVTSLKTWRSGADIMGNNYDYARVVQENQAASATAFAAYAAHEQNTQQAITGFPDVDQVPPVTNPAAATTMHSATATSTGGPAHPSAGATPTGGGAGASTMPAGATPGGATPGSASPSGSHAGDKAGGPGGGNPGAPSSTAPTTTPNSWTPIRPPTTGTGPPPSAFPRVGSPNSPTPDLPTLPPMSPIDYGDHPGTRPGAGRVGHGRVDHPLAPRGGPLAERAPIGMPVMGDAPGGRPAPGTGGGMPMGGMGAAGRGQEREHRNGVFIPSDEPFAVDDDVVPAVLGEIEYRP